MNSVVRIVLVLYFFLTCVVLPVFNILPFLEQTISREVWGPPTTILYYHEAIGDLGQPDSWSQFGIYWRTFTPWMVIRWLEWIMPFLGTLTFVLAVWVFIQEFYTTHSSIFPFFRKVSFLALGSIWLEWISFFYIILGEEWFDPIPERYIFPPIPNTFLLGLMFSGTLALLWATSATLLWKDREVSSTKTHDIQESHLAKEIYQKNKMRFILRVVLIGGFFFTCVGIPFLRLTPFMQGSLYHGGFPAFFFDHSSGDGYKRPYLNYPNQFDFWLFIGVSGWIFIGFGTCVLGVTIYSIINGSEFREKSFLPVLRMFSKIAILSIIIEWILFLVGMGDYQTTVFPNFLLLGIMICGSICLIIANLIPVSSTIITSSLNDRILQS